MVDFRSIDSRPFPTVMLVIVTHSLSMLIESKTHSGNFPFQVLVVITDGKQTTTKPYTKLSVASQGVKSKDVAVYAVGVGKGVDGAELREIASSQENVFVSASFKELQTLAVEIRKRLCEGLFPK